MPNGLMERFLTRRSFAILTGSLAFTIAYWYIKRRRSMKYSASENKNKKIAEKSCRQQRSVILENSKSDSTETAETPEVVKTNGNMPSVVKSMDEEELPDTVVRNDVSVLKEISNNSMSKSREDPNGGLPCENETSAGTVIEIAESQLTQKELESEVEKFCTVKKYGSSLSSTDSSSGERSINSNSGGYRPVNTPSSEGSQDSGRATGGLASSLSPADDVTPSENVLMQPVYEFEIPNSLVGLIIGIRGKTIKELCIRTDVKMVIRPHHTPAKVETHQICTVEGARDNINKCLRMMRRRFPVERFPELNLRPVLPPVFAEPPAEFYSVRPTQLTLPEGERFQVLCSAVIDCGHFFLQQPLHPTFGALHRLDYYMLGVYTQPTGVPDLPKPVDVDVLCVAPSLDGWYRALTLEYYPEEDEVLVLFVDYGGILRLPRSDLRQIRTDFLSLPFQVTECYLAHVEPVDGTTKWSDEAIMLFHKLIQRHLECFVVGYNAADLKPYVELFAIDENNRVDRVDCALLEAGVAKVADPSKIRPVIPRYVPSGL